MRRTKTEVRDVAESLFASLEATAWTGPDPYDGLTSPFAVLARTPKARQAVLQAVKRSPVDLRGALRIRPITTAMSLGLASTACRRFNDRDWIARSDLLAHRVAGEQLVGEYAGLWRYEFDVQTRWGYYPRHIPNLVATTFAADACLLAASLTSSGLLALARGLLRLFSGSHFTYTPRSGELIHNANLMGASLASRLSLERDLPEELREQLCAAAEKAVNTSVGMQRSDGSWPYGEKSSLQWVDGFHTGYVLIRLDEAAQALGRDLSEALARGSQYYFEHLFDGASPRYFANRGGHEDPTNASTAVVVAAWAARKRLADPSFPDAVLNSILPWFTRRGVLSATLSAPPLWRSPRWSMVPLLDALGAVYGVVDA